MLKNEKFPEADKALYGGWGGREHLQQQRMAEGKAERLGEPWSSFCKLFIELKYVVPETVGQEARQGTGAETEEGLGF